MQKLAQIKYECNLYLNMLCHSGGYDREAVFRWGTVEHQGSPDTWSRAAAERCHHLWVAPVPRSPATLGDVQCTGAGTFPVFTPEGADTDRGNFYHSLTIIFPIHGLAYYILHHTLFCTLQHNVACSANASYLQYVL